MGDVRVPNLNKVIICGRLANDPDLKYTPSGAAVCKLRVANTRYFRNRNGDRSEDTCFIDATIWERQAEYCGEHLHKGRPVLIEGRLKQENWEDRATGQPRSKLVIAATNVAPLDWDEDGGVRNGGGNRGYADRAHGDNAQSGGRYQDSRYEQTPYKEDGDFDDEPIPDDDIPF